MKRCLIAVGTYPQQFAQYFDGDCLFFDTAESVRHADSESCRAIQLTPGTASKPRPDIPAKLLEYSNRDGSAHVECRAYKIVTDTEWFPRLIERFVANASEVFVFSSSGGGTGNGVCDPLIDDLRSLHPSGRVIFIHAIDPAVNGTKQMQRIRLIREKGTKDELHLLVRSPETIRQALSLKRQSLDAIHEITVNIRTLEVSI